MAVQQLAKDQAKREKKNQKDLDEQFKKDDENAEKDAQRMMDLMDRIYNKSKDLKAPKSIEPNQRLLNTLERNMKIAEDFKKDIIGAKSGGQIKCGVQTKGTSPLIKKRKGKK
jgi:predicted translin family RNA/ssDNA-binding protein